MSSQRPRYTYNLPNADEVGVKTITLVELKADEELLATKRARSDPFRLAYELAKTCLVALDGKAIDVTDGSREIAWDSMHPKVRAFVVQAYTSLHQPKEEEVSDFLLSRQVET